MNSLAIMHLPQQASNLRTPQTRVRSGTLPSGITVKMDLFARHVAGGMSLADAYRQAFNTANMKSKTVSNDASRLARHHGISAAIEAYRAENDARNRMLALQRDERIWERVWELVENDEVPPAVRVKALDLAARLAGMFKAPKDEEPLSAAAVEVELQRKLQGLLISSPVN